ncbi:hypothetical protein BDQ17DRAFT_1329502 [Cyathus striatus]|nr:hypothetical protein BDQ17DRAFT_1329502 [Cyathus striatus]
MASKSQEWLGCREYVQCEVRSRPSYLRFRYPPTSLTIFSVIPVFCSSFPPRPPVVTVPFFLVLPPKQFAKVKSAKKEALQPHYSLTPPIGSASRRIVRSSARRSMKKADILDIKGRIFLKTKWDRSSVLAKVPWTMRGPWMNRTVPSFARMNVVWPGDIDDYMDVDYSPTDLAPAAVVPAIPASTPGLFTVTVPAPSLSRSLLSPCLYSRSRPLRYSHFCSRPNRRLQSCLSPQLVPCQPLWTTFHRVFLPIVLDTPAPSFNPNHEPPAASEAKKEIVLGSVKDSMHAPRRTEKMKNEGLESAKGSERPSFQSENTNGSTSSIGPQSTLHNGSTTPPDTPPALKVKRGKGKGKASASAAEGDSDKLGVHTSRSSSASVGERGSSTSNKGKGPSKSSVNVTQKEAVLGNIAVHRPHFHALDPRPQHHQGSTTPPDTPPAMKVKRDKSKEMERAKEGAGEGNKSTSLTVGGTKKVKGKIKKKEGAGSRDENTSSVCQMRKEKAKENASAVLNEVSNIPPKALPVLRAKKAQKVEKKGEADLLSNDGSTTPPGSPLAIQTRRDKGKGKAEEDFSSIPHTAVDTSSAVPLLSTSPSSNTSSTSLSSTIALTPSFHVSSYGASSSSSSSTSTSSTICSSFSSSSSSPTPPFVSSCTSLASSLPPPPPLLSSPAKHTSPVLDCTATHPVPASNEQQMKKDHNVDEQLSVPFIVISPPTDDKAVVAPPPASTAAFPVSSANGQPVSTSTPSLLPAEHAGTLTEKKHACTDVSSAINPAIQQDDTKKISSASAAPVPSTTTQSEKASDVSQVQGSSAARERELKELLQRARNSKKVSKAGLDSVVSLPTYLDDWLDEWREKTGTRLTISGVSLLFGGTLVPQYEREQPKAWPSPKTRLPMSDREERKRVPPSEEDEDIPVPPMKCLPIPPKRWWLNTDGGLEKGRFNPHCLLFVRSSVLIQVTIKRRPTTFVEDL